MKMTRLKIIEFLAEVTSRLHREGLCGHGITDDFYYWAFRDSAMAKNYQARVVMLVKSSGVTFTELKFAFSGKREEVLTLRFDSFTS